MDFSIFYQLKNKQYRWLDSAFALSYVLLIATVICYGIFWVKVYLQNQKNQDIDQQLLLYGTPEQKEWEKTAQAYKKQVDDFSVLVKNHRISSNLFSFIEENTLPEVWFSSISVAQESGRVNLLGQTKDMKTLSDQVNLLESHKDVVKDITILSFEANAQGKVSFTLSVSLDPSIFKYSPPATFAPLSQDISLPTDTNE